MDQWLEKCEYGSGASLRRRYLDNDSCYLLLIFKVGSRGSSSAVLTLTNKRARCYGLPIKDMEDSS